MKKENPTAPRSLVNSVRLLAAAGGIAMISTGECELIFIGVFISFFLLGMKIKDFPAVSLVVSKVQAYLAVLVFGVAVVDFMFLSNSFLLSVAHFLLSLQGLRMLVLRTNRENLGSILLSSMMMLSASTLAVDWSYFVLLVAFLAVVIWTLILYTVLEESQLIATSDNRAALQENTLLWRQVMPVMRASTLAAFALTALCCAAVFTVFPRFNFQGFRGQFLQPVRKTGFTAQVELGQNSRIFTDDSVVMRVEIDPKDRARWGGYIRGRSLNEFDGRVWKNSTTPVGHAFTNGRGEIVLSQQGMRPGELLRQNIYLESMDSPLLFAAPSPWRLVMDRPFVDYFPDGAVQRSNNDSWRIHYAVDSSVSPLDPATDRKKLSPHFQRPLYNDNTLAVPESMSKLKELAATLTAKAETDLEKADRIAAYLQGNFRYSLQPVPARKGGDPIEQFLLETKQGHCEYFAAAMCLMLRSQGIRTRMATGFLSQEWNRRGNYYLVRMKHAHAWVEADISPYGWMGFDPSPRDFTVTGASDLTQRWSELTDYLNLRWNRYILSYDFEKQVAIARTVSQQSGTISANMGRFVGSIQNWVGSLKLHRLNWSSVSEGGHKIGLLLPLVFIVAMTLLVLGTIIRYGRRRRNRVWFYPKLVRLLEKKSGHPIAHQTLREFSRSVRPQLREKAATLDYLQTEYYRLRFDPSAQLSAADSAAIRNALKALS